MGIYVYVLVLIEHYANSKTKNQHSMIDIKGVYRSKDSAWKVLGNVMMTAYDSDIQKIDVKENGMDIFMNAQDNINVMYEYRIKKVLFNHDL